jgi:hypothetical protein
VRGHVLWSSSPPLLPMTRDAQYWIHKANLELERAYNRLFRTLKADQKRVAKMERLAGVKNRLKKGGWVEVSLQPNLIGFGLRVGAGFQVRRSRLDGSEQIYLRRWVVLAHRAGYTVTQVKAAVRSPAELKTLKGALMLDPANQEREGNPVLMGQAEVIR